MDEINGLDAPGGNRAIGLLGGAVATSHFNSLLSTEARIRLYKNCRLHCLQSQLPEIHEIGAGILQMPPYPIREGYMSETNGSLKKLWCFCDLDAAHKLQSTKRREPI